MTLKDGLAELSHSAVAKIVERTKTTVRTPKDDGKAIG